MKEERTCIACRKQMCKSEMIRIVSEDGKALIDEKQKKNTRGVYICKNCLNKSASIRKLSRISKIQTTETEIRRIINELGEVQIGKNQSKGNS